MDLFADQHDPKHNWLPYDGEVYYHGPVMSCTEADGHLQHLRQTLAWQPDRVKVMGKLITTRRMVAWYASQPFAYTYSGVTKTALPWTDALLRLKQLVEADTDATYNACLANMYHDGRDGMAYHSDNEKDLLPQAPIASLSLGAERRFCFKHKRTNEVVELHLAHGSLLVMQGKTQTNWRHRLPIVAGLDKPRVNLTFRTLSPAES
ncbi:MAG: alpha-ketoglutarate-dependent dioxygenase AlkB [Gammaproteobacteria bacterium]|nr:alpha-ketoglutarate-dependent dioxygenase AlkB [Gammaproteobacteria bacterium]